MRVSVSPLSPDAWIADLFGSRAAASGGVIRRKKRDIERYVGWQPFLAAVRHRGFHAIKNAGQIIIFCNQDPIRRIL